MLNMKIKIIIPIYRPDDKFIRLLEMIKKQTTKNLSVLIIDSGSDGLYKKAIAGIRCFVKNIDPQTFNHGGTRQMGIDMYPDTDLYVFLTQDAILADEYAIENLVRVFKNPQVGCAYGRQLPHQGAGLFASHARLFNYPDKSYVRSLKDKDKYGMKTAFLSNSFAAYRKEAMADINGFPTNTILSEDMYVAAKMLLKGWCVAYAADAEVYHSHDYTIWQEFKRYFDIGVFHAREAWIRETFGAAEGEGKRFVLSEAKYLMKHNPLLLPEMVVRDGMKFIGYRLGIKENLFNEGLKRKISMTSRYWK